VQSGSAAAVQPRYGAAARVLGNEATRTFNAVLQHPKCAIAYWGLAMSYQQNPRLNTNGFLKIRLA
jgi:hypothetical protein